MTILAGGRRNPWLRPAVQVALGFLGLILVGTLLLLLPRAVAAGKAPLDWSGALFTATSATCVTGLTVVDTAHHLSFFGQAVVLGLIQLGGLGIMTLALLVVLSLGAGGGTEAAELLDSTLAAPWVHEQPRRALGFLLAGVLLTEAAGTLCLWLGLQGPDRNLWTACFLSVSAFCNAGFDNLEAGLGPYAGSWAVGLPLLLLWLGGGLGFLLPAGLLARRWGRRGRRVLDLTTRMVLVGSAVLVPLGALVFALCEADGLLAGRAPGEKLLLCLFQGNTPRTAGFSMLPMAEASRATLLALVPFMLVGAAPGGTAGGIKIPTAAVFLATLRARLRGADEVVVGRRTLPLQTIRRALLVFLLMLFAFLGCSFLLGVLEAHNHPLDALVFEAASALGTVGLSTGITPELGTGSRLVLAAAMFLGRLGPLTLVYALLRQRPFQTVVRYPREEVFVG